MVSKRQMCQTIILTLLSVQFIGRTKRKTRLHLEEVGIEIGGRKLTFKICISYHIIGRKQ